MTQQTTEPLNLRLADIAISPLNVRFNEKDAEAVEALSASIAEHGLLEQLLIHPAPEGAAWADRAPGDAETYDQRAPAAFGVLAGGRRYRAIRLAVARGRLPKTFPIRCEIKDLSRPQIIMLSLSENLLRRDLQGYEVHKAIADLIAEGMTIDQIAQELGQEPSWVRQQARLGALHPPIFSAYCAGELSVDQARAFAATEEPELQEQAWAHFARQPSYNRAPEQIRAFYKVGDHQLARLLHFVGEKAYREAGGHFELDLFAGEKDHRGRVEDEALLHKLAEAKLKLTRAAIREKAGWRDLAFAAEPPQRAGYTDTALEIHLDKPEQLKAAVPAATPDSAIVVTLEIASTGKAIARYWWASRKEKSDATNKPAGSAGRSERLDVGESHAIESPGLYAQDANAMARDDHGLTNSGLQVCRSMRRDLLRSTLLRDAGVGGNLAHDYLVFALLRQELRIDRGATVGMRRLASAHETHEDERPDEVRPWLEGQLAGQYWKSAVEELLGRDFLSIEDPAEALCAYISADPGTKALAAAVLVGLALTRSAATPGYQVAVHDKLAELAGADAEQLRRFWQPDNAFCGLFTKMKRMELCQPFVEADALKTWVKLDDRTLTEASAHVLTEEKGWIHPLLSFDFDGFEAAKLEEKELEAAE